MTTVEAKEIIHAMKRYYIVESTWHHRGLNHLRELLSKAKSKASILENLYCDECREIDMLNLVLVVYRRNEEWKMCLCDVSKICTILSTSMEAWAKTFSVTNLEVLYKIATIVMQFYESTDKVKFLENEKFVKIK